MATTISKQDVQSMIDAAKNKILERIVPRYDMQLMYTQTRDNIVTHQRNLHQITQQLFRQAVTATDQFQNRVALLEARMASLEQELKAVHHKLDQLLEGQAHTSIPAGQSIPATDEGVAPAGGRWQYSRAY